MYELTDAEWIKIRELIPKGKVGRPCLNLRQTLSGIKWMMKSGSSWRTLPPEYGSAVNIVLSAGNVNDITVAPTLLEGITLEGSVVMADKAYCARSFLYLIKSKGAKSCIPCSKSFKLRWKVDKEQYKKRNVVEHFFLRLKENRRIATRYNKLADRFLAFIHFACIFLWFK